MKKKATKKKSVAKELWVVVDTANGHVGVYDDINKANDAAEIYSAANDMCREWDLLVAKAKLNDKMYSKYDLPNTKDGQTIIIDGLKYKLTLI